MSPFFPFLPERFSQKEFLEMAQIIRRIKSFVGLNFRQPKFSAGPYFRHLSNISSLRSDIVWSDKVDRLQMHTATSTAMLLYRKSYVDT